MFNIKTEELIKSIPKIDGVDIEHLPQLLARTYSMIVCRHSQPQDNITENEMELKSAYEELQKISFSLELYLLSPNQKVKQKAISYVVALCRTMMGMVEKEEFVFSVDSMPSDIVAALFYVICGNYADAMEIARKIPTDNIQGTKGSLYKAIQYLLMGKLQELNYLKIQVNDDNENLMLYAEDLLCAELAKGIVSLGHCLLQGGDYDYSQFKNVEVLSIEHGENEMYNDLYPSTFRLARMLRLSAESLIAHSLINLPASNGLDKDEWIKALQKIAEKRPYLWDNHIDAIQKGILVYGISSILVFPTGAGKSILCDLKVLATLLRGKKVLYIVPTHALEFQVKKNMSRMFNSIMSIGNNVGGEYTQINDEECTDIWVMTPECCLTKLSIQKDYFANIGLVVFDEFHIIHGGSGNKRSLDSMLCLIDLLTQYKEADFLMVSAMVKNGKEIAEWVSSMMDKECILLDNPWKPTCQLQGCLVYNTNDVQILDKNIQNSRKKRETKGPSKKLKESMYIHPYCLFSLKSQWDSMAYDDYKLINVLDHKTLLTINNFWQLSGNCNTVSSDIAMQYGRMGYKVIIFAMSPDYVQSIVRKINNIINRKIDESIGRHNILVRKISMELGNFSYSYLSDSGFATMHHSDLMPEERILSENLYSENSSAIMVATPTISQGINLPVDMVVIAGISRYNEEQEGQEMIAAHELLNAVGRAGRAGFNSRGVSIVVPNKVLHIDGKEIDNKWFEIKENVFSNGDNCLEIKDPIEKILNDIEMGQPISVSQSAMLYRINSSPNALSSNISQSLYAYTCKTKEKKDRFNAQFSILKDYLNKNEVKGKNPISMEISAQCGVGSTDVDRIILAIDETTLQTLIGYDIPQMLSWVFDIFKKNLDLFVNLIQDESLLKKMRKCLIPKSETFLSEELIEKLYQLTSMYITGKNYEELESIFPKQKEKLKNARFFVLKFIPTLSYACGIFSLAIVKKCIEADYDEIVIPYSIKNFSSCIKEGMDSYEKLQFMLDKKYVRVETHNKYTL